MTRGPALSPVRVCRETDTVCREPKISPVTLSSWTVPDCNVKSTAAAARSPSSQQAIAWKILCSMLLSTAHNFSPVPPVKRKPASSSGNAWHNTGYAALTCHACKLRLF